MKISRLLGIVYTLLQNERVTAPELAEKFEVSRRTINRDIETLSQAGIPIHTQQGVGGGISVVQGFRLDKSILTAAELSSLVSALKGLDSVSEKSEVERILDKLGANPDNALTPLSESLHIDLVSFYEDDLGSKVELIRGAIRERKLIEFEYHYDKGVSHRSVEPYIVAYQWGAWYIYGYCILREDWRLFKLLRMQDLTAKDEIYCPREIPDDEHDFNEDFVDATVEVVALFKQSERYKLLETYGQTYFEDVSEGLLLRMSFAHNRAALEWLLGFGDRVKVLEPDSLVTDIQLAAENILKQYH